MAENASAGAQQNEQIIATYWPSPFNGLNQMAANLPWIIGGPIFFASFALRFIVYGFDVLLAVVTLGSKRLSANVRYTLTNRSLRVDKGPERTTVMSVPLEDIEEVSVQDEYSFTRTGDLVVKTKKGEGLTLVGVFEPTCVRQTIVDAIRSKVQIAQILARQKQVATA